MDGVADKTAERRDPPVAWASRIAIPMALVVVLLAGVALPTMVALVMGASGGGRVASALPMLEVHAVARGQRLYEAACIACHAADGHGVQNLGKDLVASRFSRTMTDAQLGAFLIAGRAAGDPLNTTGVAMPPRGGRDDYTDADIADVVAYVRALQRPSRVPAGPLPEVTVATLDDEPAPVAVASAQPAGATVAAAAASAVDGGATASLAAATQTIDPETLKRGKKVFNTCIACHGRTGDGVKGTGADLAHSTFVATRSDAELVEFIRTGRAPGGPGSVMGLNMPAKGGNPAMKEAQIADVVAYLRHLQQQAKPAGQ